MLDSTTPPQRVGGSASGAGACESQAGSRSRVSEIAEVVTLVHTHRLVTIVGSYGVGKTWLAGRVEDRLRTEPNVRVVHCDLTPAHSLGELESCLGLKAALELDRDPDGTPLESLLKALGPAVAVLDNLEQLGEIGATAIAQLLAIAPDLRVLVTTRERLRLIDEICFELQPLSLDDAVALLVDRARALAPDFAIGPHNRAAMVRIAEQVDRLPLAIEMTAPWLQVLSSSELAERLANGLQLEHDGRPVTRHHASLDMAIAWSWDLLSAVEQMFLLQVSIFTGRFTLADAQAIVVLPAGSPPILTLVRRLRERSLLLTHRRAHPSRVEFSLSAGIRRFAWERALHGTDVTALGARLLNHLERCVTEVLLDEVDAAGGCERLELQRFRQETLGLRGRLGPRGAADEARLAGLLMRTATDDKGQEAAPGAAIVAGALSDKERPQFSAPPAIVFGPRLDWLRIGDGEPVQLGRRGAVRLLLAALVDAARERPGEPLSLEDLFGAGWPGERIAPESMSNRVYAALSALRRLGLEPVLWTRREGWLLDPAVISGA